MSSYQKAWLILLCCSLTHCFNLVVWVYSTHISSGLMIHFHDSCDFALLRQLTWMWFLKVIVSEPFSHNYTRLHHPLLQIRLWTRCYDSKHASSHPHDMETMAWWFHKVAGKFFMSMKNSLCFSACVEFHAPVIIVLALLAWHFPKWACFGFSLSLECFLIP